MIVIKILKHNFIESFTRWCCNISRDARIKKPLFHLPPRIETTNNWLLFETCDYFFFPRISRPINEHYSRHVIDFLEKFEPREKHKWFNSSQPAEKSDFQYRIKKNKYRPRGERGERGKVCPQILSKLRVFRADAVVRQNQWILQIFSAWGSWISPASNSPRTDEESTLWTYMSRISGAFIFCLLKKWTHLLLILRSL